MSAALEKASNEKPRGDVTLTARREGNSLVATIHATVPANDDLMLAIVEDGVTTKIEHGENAGRTLTNDAIVRKLDSREAGPDDSDRSARRRMAQRQRHRVRAGPRHARHRRSSNDASEVIVTQFRSWIGLISVSLLLAVAAVFSSARSTRS